MTETAVQYTKEEMDMLNKAGLISKGIIEIFARVSDTKHPQSTDGRTWNMSPTMGRSTEDRRTNTDKVVPTHIGGRINGYWKYKVSKEEFEYLSQHLGIPTFTVASTTRRTDGEEIIIEDTIIPVFHGKTYDLSDPVQHAEWLVVRESGIIAPEVRDTNGVLVVSSKDNVWTDPWYSFYFVNTEEAAQQEVRKTDDTMNFVITMSSKSIEEKALLIKLMHYRNYNIIENIDLAPISLLASKFNDMLLDKRKHLFIADTIALEDKPAHLQLFRLIQMGRVTAYGDNGPYHHERTGTQQRGALLGNTLAEAVRNLSKPEHVHLLSFLTTKNASADNVEQRSGLLDRIVDAKYGEFGRKVEAGEHKSMKNGQLVDFLKSVGIEPDGNNQMKLLSQATKAYEEWKERQPADDNNDND